MARPGGARALLLAAAALFCLCCWAAVPVAAQPASAAVALEQASAGQTEAAEQQARQQAELAGAVEQANQPAGGTDQQAGDQTGDTGQQSEAAALALADPTAEQLLQETAAEAAAANQADTQQQAAAGDTAAASDSPQGQGVVVLVVYKQPGKGLSEDQAIAKATASSASLREFVRRLTGGLGPPSTPLESISFVGAQGFDPSTMDGVTDTGCDSLPGTWVQANIRVNTPDAYDAYQNISSSLSGAASSATQARWDATMGQVAGNAPVPCFGQNFTSFRYTPASTPPPAPPSPPPPSPVKAPPAYALPPPQPREPDSPSPAGPFFPITGGISSGVATGGTDSSGGADTSGADTSGGSYGSDSSGSADTAGADTPGADTSGPVAPSNSGASTSAAGGTVGNPAYGSSPTPVYTSPSVAGPEYASPGAAGAGSSPNLDAATGVTGGGTAGGIGGGIGGSPGVTNSPGVSSPSVASPVPIGGASPPQSPLPVPSYTPVLTPPAGYAPTPPSVYVPSTPYVNGGASALPPGEDPFAGASAPAMAPTAAPVAQCTAEPVCKLFVGDAMCCRNKGAIAAGASLRLWLVCNRDVYLPETKCLTVTQMAPKVDLTLADPLFPDPLNTVNVSVLDRPNARSTEYGVGLPLAFLVPPISTSPGRLKVKLDFEEKRMEEKDGSCSLRLREPCEWDGKLYAAVPPVDVLPVMSVLSASDVASAYAQVQTSLAEAKKMAEQAAAAYSDGSSTDASGSVSTSSLRSAGRSLLGLLGRQLQAEKAKQQETSDKPKTNADDKKKATGGNKKKSTGGDKKEDDSEKKKEDDSDKKKDKGKGGKKETKKGAKKEQVAKKEVTGSSGGLNVAASGQAAVGGDLPVPSISAAALPPLTDVLASNYTSDVNVEEFSLSWVPLQAGAGQPTCESAATADLPESFLLGDFQELKGSEQACSDSQVGTDLPSAADLAASAAAEQSPATSGACRRFSLF